MRVRVPLTIVCCLSFSPVQAERLPRCVPMSLPVAAIEAAPEQYEVFCTNETGACDLDGGEILDWTQALYDTLVRVNNTVNEEIESVSDWELSGLMDSWDFPFDCQGDCEDLALEKRRRLVAASPPGVDRLRSASVRGVRHLPLLDAPPAAPNSRASELSWR